MRLSVVGDDFILGDKLMIQRAISNLLSNAIRHAPVDSTVPIEIISQSNQAFLSISNSGPGIPTQHLHKIFERFYRVDSGRSRAEGGIGLGLAMVRTIMEFHNGTVTVESDIQGPTKFTLTFRKINHD